MIKFALGWDTEQKDAFKGKDAFHKAFGEADIINALYRASQDSWFCQALGRAKGGYFFAEACDPFSDKWIEVYQGAHQPEEMGSAGGFGPGREAGFVLHFTARTSNYGKGIHFYLRQQKATTNLVVIAISKGGEVFERPGWRME